MYSKDEASQLKQAFWTAFGQYIALHKSAEGLKVNWLNYNTGQKNVYFRLKADKKKASIGIDIAYGDAEIRELFFEQFLTHKKILESYMQEEWNWELHSLKEDNISRIYKEINQVNVLNKDDWPALISFFKPRLLALDEYWANAQYDFDSLK